MSYHSATTEFLATRLAGVIPDWALVLGSGWGFFADEHMSVEQRIPYGDIPGFPTTKVAGHAGCLVVGTVGAARIACFQGRFHYYEGHSMQTVTLPVRAMAALGVGNLLVTNAAGGIRNDLVPGTLMLISDHINAMGDHPLRGPNEDALGPRFPDMTAAYDPRLRADLSSKAAASGIALAEGVYLAVSGPTFETPAEIRAFRAWGADAVGMSTVPECIVARHAGMRVLGLSCITNQAAGLGSQALSHEDVAHTAGQVRDRVAETLMLALQS